ncbi:MAG: hypothetical protein AAF462_03615 [Thermodesulfobacteriota bacterium]
MIRYSLILILAVLLGISSYLLYEGKYIVINIESGSINTQNTLVQGREDVPDKPNLVKQVQPTPKVTLAPDLKEDIVFFEDESDTEIHLEPTVGIDINPEQKIATSYKAIGPKEFVLLTDDDKPMVEINLETGQVEVNPEYELDEVSTEFWNSISKKYPEVCYVEKN